MKTRGFYPIPSQTNLKKRAPIKNINKKKKKKVKTHFVKPN